MRCVVSVVLDDSVSSVFECLNFSLLPDGYDLAETPMFSVIQRRPKARILIRDLTLRQALTLVEAGRHSGFEMTMFCSRSSRIANAVL